MTIKVGVGKSNVKNAIEAGQIAARQAMREADVITCSFVYLFATTGYDQHLLLEGVRSVTGDAPLSGCSSGGIITQEGPDGEIMFPLSGTATGSEAVGVMVLYSDDVTFSNGIQQGVQENPSAVGKKIAEDINAGCPEGTHFLQLFPDGFLTNVHALFTSLEQSLTSPLPFIGGASGHNLTQSTRTYQYFNAEVHSNAVAYVWVSGEVNYLMEVSHGCVPIGLEKKITRSEGNTVFSIEDQPTWHFFQEYLGKDVKDLTSESSPSVSIGIRLPEELVGDYDEYIIRAPYLLNEDNSVVFADTIPEGTHIQLVRRDEDRITQSTARLAQRLKERLQGKKPLAILQFDCAGRGKMFFGDQVKEKGIDVIQDVLGKDIPWLGFYCFGEIAPIRNHNYYHNHTVALCVLY